MNSHHFIHDQKVVESTLMGLQATGTITGYLSEEFIDPKTQRRWEKYPIGYDENGDDEFGLRRLPYPTTKELVGIAVNSEIVDEIEGASMLLKSQEWNHRIEFREHLIEAIELNLNMIDPNRFSIISGCTELTALVNRREIVGKSDAEIESDYEYFKNLSVRARELENGFGLNADHK